MKKTIFSLILIILIIFAVAILIISKNTVPPLETETIKIGFIGPLSGDSAIIGEENLKGARLAVDYLNLQPEFTKRKIELIAKDDQLNEKETLTAYKQLIEIENADHALIVAYGGFLALADRAEADNIILMSSLDTSEELTNLSNNTFAVGIYDESIGYAIADHLNKGGVEEIGLMTNLEDPFMLLVESTIEERYKGRILKENFNFTTKDFRTTLTKLAGKEYLAVLGFEETGIIVRQARELSMNNKIIGIDTFASQDFRDNTNGNFEGLEFTFWQGADDNAKYAEMLEAYNHKYGKQPENVLFVSTGYDAMLVLGEAIKICSTDIACTADYLRNDIKDFPGATGPITIDQDGITRSIRETIYAYKDGEIVELEQ